MAALLSLAVGLTVGVLVWCIISLRQRHIARLHKNTQLIRRFVPD